MTRLLGFRIATVPLWAGAADGISSHADGDCRHLGGKRAASGGALLRVETDDGESAFDRVLRENAGYYLLGVEPAASDRDGKLRELKVRVRARGTTVRHRSWVIVPK